MKPELESRHVSKESDEPFRAALTHLLNKHSMENGSDTPDFILAGYLADCLKAFDKAQIRRKGWYEQ